MAKTAVVILNWNGAKFLREFIPILVKHTSLPDVELVVADNGSTDDSVSFLEEEQPAVKIIKLDMNHGFAGGYNRALKQVEADYFLLLNSDVEVTERWIEPLIAKMEEQSELAACSPLLADYHKRKSYEYAGAAGGYIDKYGYTFCRGRLFEWMEDVQDDYRQDVPVFWTTGACMIIRRTAFIKAGGFDEHFFAHMEEVDLCWRMKNMGYQLMNVPASKVYHVGGATLHKSNPLKTYLNFRNNLFMLYKNLPENKLAKVLFIRKLLDLLSVVRFLVTLSFKDIGAIFRAHRDFRRGKKKYKSFREEQKKHIVKQEHEEQYTKSIVSEYFLMGKRRFSNLKGDFALKFME